MTNTFDVEIKGAHKWRPLVEDVDEWFAAKVVGRCENLGWVARIVDHVQERVLQ